MKSTSFIQVKDGRPNTNPFKQLKDGRYRVEVSGYSKRSNPQNAYYWGCVLPMVQEGIKYLGTELTQGETHDFLKGRFNTVLIADGLVAPKSTAALSKVEFSEYIEKVRLFAADFLGVVIPDPSGQIEAFTN